jgi:hypothetical protein
LILATFENIVYVSERNWMEHIVRMRQMRNAHKTVFRKPEMHRSLGRSRRRSEDSIKMDLIK